MGSGKNQPDCLVFSGRNRYIPWICDRLYRLPLPVQTKATLSGVDLVAANNPADHYGVGDVGVVCQNWSCWQGDFDHHST